MGNYRTFKDQMISILDSVQIQSSSAFVEVKGFPTNSFDGYPAATVYPAGTPSRYETNVQNYRDYGFIIDLYFPLSGEDWSAAVSTMCDLLDAVMDTLDRSNDLNGEADNLAAQAVDNWNLAPAEQGLALVASLRVTASKLIDIA